MKPVSELIDLSGKTAIVTGGAMGIGLGIVNRLAEAGANIVVADIAETEGQQVVNDLQKKKHKAAFFKTDVSQENDVRSLVDFAVESFGGVDILVNNAGIYPLVPALDMDPELFDKILSVNLKSVFFLTKVVSKLMIKQGRGGKIINITSIDALHPSSVGFAVYDATKHGLWGFTKNTALELAPHNIQVNAIAPGGIETPGTGAGKPTSAELKKVRDLFVTKIPMKRFGESDEIGTVALFLASGLSSYMTGSQIVVDGGVLLS